MLTLKPQGKIVERIVRARTGQFVRAVFLVLESEGGLDVRLLSVCPIKKSGKANSYKLQANSFSLCLRGNCLKSSPVISHRPRYIPTVSPFFNTLEFFVSQPTRAPSL